MLRLIDIRIAVPDHLRDRLFHVRRGALRRALNDSFEMFMARRGSVRCLALVEAMRIRRQGATPIRVHMDCPRWLIDLQEWSIERS